MLLNNILILGSISVLQCSVLRYAIITTFDIGDGFLFRLLRLRQFC